jgi:hypothetical protein
MSEKPPAKVFKTTSLSKIVDVRTSTLVEEEGEPSREKRKEKGKKTAKRKEKAKGTPQEAEGVTFASPPVSLSIPLSQATSGDLRPPSSHRRASDPSQSVDDLGGNERREKRKRREKAGESKSPPLETEENATKEINDNSKRKQRVKKMVRHLILCVDSLRIPFFSPGRE